MTENKPEILCVVMKGGKVFIQEDNLTLLEGAKPAVLKKYKRAEFRKMGIALYINDRQYYAIPYSNIEYKIEKEVSK